jgi:hypothetical protein
MTDITYIKRSNKRLFKDFQMPNLLNISAPQNYSPLYDSFFTLSQCNHNLFNLNHKHFLKSVDSKDGNSPYVFNCTISNIHNETSQITKPVFFKMAPLFDPTKLLTGGVSNSESVYTLPTYGNKSLSHSYMNTIYNTSYIDGFFSYLSDSLIEPYNFMHGVVFYGCFLGIKHDFLYDIVDEMDILAQSKYFINNRHKMYTITDEYMNDVTGTFEDGIEPLVINYTDETCQLQIDASLDDTLDNVPQAIPLTPESKKTYLDETALNIHNSKSISDNDLGSEHSSVEDSSVSSHTHTESDNSISNDDASHSTLSEEESETSSDYDDAILITIDKFPVQIIAQENCAGKFSDIIMDGLSPTEWYSAFMQIIMILIIYQKTFKFTHNDLHTNNIMYNNTTKKYLYYLFQEQYYKVPTFGRIYKLIDFGRSIYTVKGRIMCSDSFSKHGGAYTQYNTEPFFNPDKPRIDPNPSFDICRMACSIYDQLIHDLDEIASLKLSGLDAVTRLVVEWCKDDAGKCILYKSNGDERYPDFKLYKMIARTVHAHTPHAQLKRAEFRQFCTTHDKMKCPKNFINIDEMNDLSKGV